MYPRGYGNSEDPYRPQHRMMQDPHREQHLQHHVQHYPPEHGTPSFQHPSSFHYPPAPGPPFDSYPPSGTPPPEYPSPFYPSAPTHQSVYPPPPAPYPPQYGVPAPYPPQYGMPPPPSFESHQHFAPAHAHDNPTRQEHSFSSSEHAYPPTFGEHKHSFSAHDYYSSSRKEHSLSSTEPAYPPTFGEHRLSSLEHADHLPPTHGEHTHLSSEQAYARPGFDHTHSTSFPHHTSSFQEKKPWISEGDSFATPESLPSSSIGHSPANVELPKGQLVRVFCKSDRSFNLAVKNGRLLMVEADSGNESQQWIRDDRYSIRVRDSYGHPAFMLINKANKKVLKHAQGRLQEVQLMDYSSDIQDDDLFWTESQDFGEGFKTLRMASDTLLNLSVGHGHSVEDGCPLLLDTWHKKDNQLWKIFPL